MFVAYLPFATSIQFSRRNTHSIHRFANDTRRWWWWTYKRRKLPACMCDIYLNIAKEKQQTKMKSQWKRDGGGWETKKWWWVDRDGWREKGQRWKMRKLEYLFFFLRYFFFIVFVFLPLLYCYYSILCV